MTHCSRGKTYQWGATVLEMALIVAVSGAVAGGAILALSSAGDAKNAGDERLALDLAGQAVRDFILREKRLPCPDLDGNGLEGAGSTATCSAPGAVGLLPYLSLMMDPPALAAGTVIRFGVSRNAGADLAVRGTAPPSGQVDVDGSHRLYAKALQAAVTAGTSTGQPFVAARDASGKRSNCALTTDQPAFVLAVANATATGMCFSDDEAAAPVGSASLVSVGHAELIGWLHARTR